MPTGRQGFSAPNTKYYTLIIVLIAGGASKGSALDGLVNTIKKHCRTGTDGLPHSLANVEIIRVANLRQAVKKFA